MLDLAAIAALVDDAQREAKAISQITEAHPDFTVDDGYAVQALAIGRRVARGERRVGVKMGLTSRAKMIQVNVDEIIWGVLCEPMAVEDGSRIDLGRFIHPRVEPEIAFRLRKPLSGTVGALAAADAIEAVAPAMEIIDSRFRDFKFRVADVVADNSSSSAFVIGPWLRRETDLSNLGMIMSFDGRPVQVGSSAAILGHPLRSLIAAARLTSRNGGDGLHEGDIVLAGGATAAEPLRPGLDVRLEVQHLGRVTFQTGGDA